MIQSFCQINNALTKRGYTLYSGKNYYWKFHLTLEGRKASNFSFGKTLARRMKMTDTYFQATYEVVCPPYLALKSLTQYHTILHVDALNRYIAVENIVRKGEITCINQFLLFSQCFLPYMVLIFHFNCTLKCRLQFVSIWTSLKCCRL